MWWHLLCPHSWRPAGWSSYGFQIPSGAISHDIDAWNLPISWTLKTLMRRLMLYFSHFWIHDLVRAKVIGVGLPITLIAPSLNLGLIVVPSPIHVALAWGQAWAPPIIQQLFGGLLVMEMSLDYESCMVFIEVEWSKGVPAISVWCILWWWLGWLTTTLHPGLPDWC